MTDRAPALGARFIFGSEQPVDDNVIVSHERDRLDIAFSAKPTACDGDGVPKAAIAGGQFCTDEVPSRRMLNTIRCSRTVA